MNIEYGRGMENPRRLTVEGLFQENTSFFAFEDRALWDAADMSKRLITVKTCGDARLILPKTAVYLKSIAAGGEDRSYRELFEHSAGIMVMAHYDGRKFKPGIRPEGCGGQDEKAHLQQLGTKGPKSGITEFVENDIVHPDPVFNALLKAAQISRVAKDTPVLAAAQDHRTGEVHPLALLTGDSVLTNLLLAKEVKYDPVQLYQHGIPSTRKELLPSTYQSVLSELETHAKAIRAHRPDLEETQGVQNPYLLYLTTDRRPGSIKYPLSMHGPNAVFALRCPRMSGLKGFSYNEEAIHSLIAQAEYPLSHRIAHKNSSDGAFRDLATVFIETRTWESNNAITQALFSNHVFREFIQDEEVRVLRGIVDDGILREAEEYELPR